MKPPLPHCPNGPRVALASTAVCPWSQHHFVTFTDDLCAAMILHRDWRSDLRLPRVWHVNDRNRFPPVDAGFEHML